MASLRAYRLLEECEDWIGMLQELKKDILAGDYEEDEAMKLLVRALKRCDEVKKEIDSMPDEEFDPS